MRLSSSDHLNRVAGNGAAVAIGRIEFVPVASLTTGTGLVPCRDPAGISSGYGYAAGGPAGTCRAAGLLDLRSGDDGFCSAACRPRRHGFCFDRRGNAEAVERKISGRLALI